MADDGGEPTYLKVEINMRGNFVRNPHGYVGERYLVKDMDFATLDFDGFFAFLERYTGKTTRKEIYPSKVVLGTSKMMHTMHSFFKQH